MLLVRQLTTQMRVQPFRLPQTRMSTESGARWEKIIFSTSALFACLGISLSSFGLSKLAAASTEHLRKWEH